MKNLNRGTNLPFFEAIINNFNMLDQVKAQAFPAFNGSLTFFRPGNVAILIVILLAQTHLARSQHTMVEEQIAALKEGILIVVIPSYSKKIKSLEETYNQTNKNKKRHKKLIQYAKWERDSFETEIAQAMEDVYIFSDYAFLSDAHLKNFLQGDRSQVIYASKNQGEIMIKDVYFLRRGETENGAEALLVCNRKLEPLTKPFPYYVRLNGFLSIFESFFKPAPIKWKPLAETIGKLNARLQAYYEKV